MRQTSDAHKLQALSLPEIRHGFARAATDLGKIGREEFGRMMGKPETAATPEGGASRQAAKEGGARMTRRDQPRRKVGQT